MAHSLTTTIAILLSATVAFGSVTSMAAAERYASVRIDDEGQLRIVTVDRREIVPQKEREQVGFDKPAIAPNRASVGWLAVYENCCTSYPIPLKLIVYSSGRVRVFVGTELPIWRWAYQNGGKYIAFQQETVHGRTGVHYELRDIATGRLVAEYNPTIDRESLRDLAVPPKWVQELDAPR